MTKSLLAAWFGLMTFTSLAGLGHAQRRYAQLSSGKVQELEATLKVNPHDRAARRALLDYYFLGGADPSIAVPARRRHILWLIENTPEDELAGSPAATIDPVGHALADPQGFQLASQAWRAQVGKAEAKPQALLNAAYFFKTEDKAYTIELLQRAVKIEPTNKEFGARLGDEYALVILGVTTVNKNGYPLRNDRSLTTSPLAQQARATLTTSRNPYVLAKAGYMLLWQGEVLYYSRTLPFDPDPLAKAALDRAVMLEPNDREVAQYRKEYDAFQAQKDGIRGSGGRASIRAASPRAASVGRPSTPVEVASPPAVGSVVLNSVTTGMTRQQVLKLGAPASQITTDDDGHLVELFEYGGGGGNAQSRVRLVDGVVVSVQRENP